MEGVRTQRDLLEVPQDMLTGKLGLTEEQAKAFSRAMDPDILKATSLAGTMAAARVFKNKKRT